jgi:hypothetical protein
LVYISLQFATHNGDAFAHFLTNYGTGPDLNALGCLIEFCRSSSNAAERFIESAFENQAVQGHDGHDWIVGIEANAMLNRHFGGQPF